MMHVITLFVFSNPPSKIIPNSDKKKKTETDRQTHPKLCLVILSKGKGGGVGWG